MRNELLDRENVLVIVPAYNEERSIVSVLSEIRELNYKVVVVSDGSTDNTADLARSEGVAVLELAINMGVGGALRAGFQYACRHGFEAIIQVDADGQHPVDCIYQLIDAANDTKADFVIGSRFASSDASMTVNRVRRLTMRVLAWSASRSTKSRITDSTSGFRLIRQPLLSRFSVLFASNYLGDTYEAIIAAGRAGFMVREISTPLKERSVGESSSSTLQSSLLTFKVFTVALLRLHTRI